MSLSKSLADLSLNDTPCRMKFTEQVNVKRCNAVLKLSKDDIRKKFWQEQQLDMPDKIDFNSYADQVLGYLNDSIKCDGVLRREYQYAKDRKDGRIYVKYGKGLQAMQSRLRNYIAGEFYYDVDMVNCHPSLLLVLTEAHDIVAPKLREYVENREKVLAENELKKTDILMALFRDNNLRDKKRPWLSEFITELDIVKQSLNQKIGLHMIKTDNTINPLSSRLSHYLSAFENHVLQYAIEFFKEAVEVPMFDGFMVNKSKVDNMEEQLETLNKEVADKFGKHIKFCLKDTTNTVDLKEVDYVPEEYPVVKKIFELDHFLSKNPYAFWKRVMNVDGTYTFSQMTNGDFKTVCEEYKILHKNDKGRVDIVSIYNKWIEDREKRCYETVNFVPFNKLNNVPKNVYNTFQGFRINLEFEDREDEWQPRDIDNFKYLLKTLCNHDEELLLYMTNFLAHLIQYPNKNPEKIIVIQSWTGTGKDTLIRTLQDILGNMYVGVTSNIDHLFGQFNVLLQDKLIIMLNEMKGKDGLQYQEDLKALATSKEVLINQKHTKIQAQSYYCRLFIMSNNDAPVNIQVSDRRYVVLNASYDLVINQPDKEKSMKNRLFWEQYNSDLKDEHWRRTVYKYLNDIDLTGFDPNKSPVTKAHQLLREKNISPLFHYLQYLVDLEKPLEPVITHKKVERYMINQKQFFRDFRDWYEATYEDQQLKMTEANAVLVNYRLRYTDEHGKQKNSKMTLFDMKKVKLYLNQFIFRQDDDDDDVIDLGTMSSSVMEPKKKKQTFSTSHLL